MYVNPDPDGPIVAGPDTALVDPDHRINATWEALGRVYDPELGLDIVSLGLVYDVRLENGTVVVDMTLTSPGCPVSDSLPATAKFATEQEISSPVDVQVVWDPPWTPAMMQDETAAALGFRRR